MTKPNEPKGHALPNRKVLIGEVTTMAHGLDTGRVKADTEVFLSIRHTLAETWKQSEPDSEAAKDMSGHRASFTDMAAAVMKIHRQSVAAATAEKDAGLRCILNTARQDGGSKSDLQTALRLIASFADKALSEAREAGE